MVPELRKSFNQQFTEEKYQAYINELSTLFPGHLEFRVAESPVFVSRDFRDKMIAACEHIIDRILQADFKDITSKAIPPQLHVPGEDGLPHCIAFDFGVCRNEADALEPQLIEMQGFPSLFAWQVLLPDVMSKHFDFPDDYSVYLGGYNRNSYIDLLRGIIIGDEEPEHTVLLEVLPHQQKTRVDFYATEKLTGIKTVCITELVSEGRKLFYLNDGSKIEIKRIFNRVIFDDLYNQPAAVQEKGKIFHQELDVTWVPHPNWFYRISKYTLPFIRHAYVPHTDFLNLNHLPEDLENYVVKPLFSFAGQGVMIDVSREELEKISDPENWIIQRKVKYADAIETPGEPAKAEIRIFYFLEPGSDRLVPANNLARLSKGKMIGVRYNKDKDWVGGSFCLFEK